MKRNLLALALLCAATLAAPAQDHSAHGAKHGAMEDTSGEYMESMKRMDQAMGSMTMTGKPGVDFAEMMIPHHQAAIDMAKSYLASGENDPDLTALSHAIIEAQEREIQGLRAWLAKNR